MNKLFRSYCDQAFLTPTELIFDSRELKRLGDKASLMSTAVDRVATLQARQTGGDAKLRRNQIFKAVEDIMIRARTARTDPARHREQIQHAHPEIAQI